MKLKLYLVLLTCISVFIISCKTAGKLYDKGNYDEAVELAAKKLQKDPGDPKLLAIIQNAYRYAADDHERRIRTDAESNNELKWEWMYNEYSSLQRLYNAIYHVPSVYNLVMPVDYTSYLITYSEKAAEVRYQRGIAYMQRYDKQSYRNAYNEFRLALNLKPGYTDAIQKMNEAYDYAVTNVVILPIQQYGGYVYSSYLISGNNFDDQLIRKLKNNNDDEFVKFFSAWEASSRNIRTDQVIDMQLTAVNIGRYFDNYISRRVTKEVIVKETVYKPDSIIREYAKVYADIKTTTRTMQSNASLQLNVKDENGRWIGSENITANYNWRTEFTTYTGDARALSEYDKQLINRPREMAPGENEIMRCLLDEISNNAINRIKRNINF